MRVLEDHLASGQRRSERAVVFVNLDGFKELNDRYGHAAGDELLRTAAKRLRHAVREQDMVGRIGGDEFLVFCPNVGGESQATRLAGRIEAALRDSVPASVGVAWSSGDAHSADELVAKADRAMYASKRGGSPAAAMLPARQPRDAGLMTTPGWRVRPASRSARPGSYPTYTRASNSATHTGFSPPSRSNVSSVVICAPPGISSTAASFARIRTLPPTGIGAGKRTRLSP